MRITKRDKTTQAFTPNKILARIKTQAKGLKVDSDILFQEVIPLINDNITTTEIDEIIAFKAADKIIQHSDYSLLGGRILLSRQSKLIGKELQPVDLTYDFFAATTFLTKYSIKDENKTPVELPSCMYNRVAGYLHNDNEEDYLELLNEITTKKANFATPTYTNAGVPERNGMISCNLTHLEDDSFEGIENTLTKIASASKEGSGIGLLIDPLRSKDSIVESFKGNAGGVVRLADMVQAKMRFYKQGSRSGSCALYLSVWHRDIFDFLDLTLPIGDEQLRTRDLFTSVVINDLFMEKLQNNEDWYLFCPNDIKKAGLTPLYELHGEAFEVEYYKAVELGLGKKVNPKDIFDSLIKSQVESGKPYVMFKDNANKRNMQRNIGIIKQSNLCIEIFQASRPKYTPQCTLASINLAEQDSLESIAKSTKILVKALNKVVDKNKWSDDWSEAAGMDQRALAIGVAGMADFFAKRKISYESEEAKQWNKDITETMYKAFVEESMRLAIVKDKNYPSWEDSPYSKGETYIEGWSPLPEGQPIPMLNSLGLGFMPTASSAILLSVFESFEPATANLFTRRVGQGEFLVVNKYLVNELISLNLWSPEIIDKLIANQGSVQNIVEIPEDVRYRYKDVWEIPQRVLLDLAIIRNKFVDQSQSLNLYHSDAKYGKIASALMYAWKGGLKTGVYYTRTKSKLEANSKLASNQIIQNADKPKDSQFECFGCSA
jgi:ribonucleoside-diphosphate reductase alpha chain